MVHGLAPVVLETAVPVVLETAVPVVLEATVPVVVETVVPDVLESVAFVSKKVAKCVCNKNFPTGRLMAEALNCAILVQAACRQAWA